MINICKVCKSVTTQWVIGRKNTLYHHCSNCEFISKDPSHYITPEEELSRYSTHNNSLEDTSYVAYFKHFIESAVLPFVSEGKFGLDFGSGPSPVLAQLLMRDYGYAMDIYDLFYAPSKVFLGQRYDLVTCTEVVEHIPNPLETFETFKDLLLADGTLAVMTQFHTNQIEDFKKWHYIRDQSHISFFTRKTMETIAERIGLKVVYSNERKYTTFQQR